MRVGAGGVKCVGQQLELVIVHMHEHAQGVSVKRCDEARRLAFEAPVTNLNSGGWFHMNLLFRRCHQARVALLELAQLVLCVEEGWWCISRRIIWTDRF